MLRDADDIVLVDLTSEELIQRLKDGKIYLPQTAKLAQQKFFTLRNLTALRELALRRTAARVDDQMVEQLRQQAIAGPWETAERLLVCVGPDPRSMDVVRAASRLATGLNASWVAVTVETSGHEGETGAAATRLNGALALAQSLGAEIVNLVGRDLPAEILGYAERENITQIVVGRSGCGMASAPARTLAFRRSAAPRGARRRPRHHRRAFARGRASRRLSAGGLAQGDRRPEPVGRRRRRGRRRGRGGWRGRIADALDCAA